MIICLKGVNMGKIRIAVVGIGNCASALIQGIEYYRKYGPVDPLVPGLMHYDLQGYVPQDIEVVAAFDIDIRKARKPLKEALLARPNCTKLFFPHLPDFPVVVSQGRLLDGVPDHMQNYPDDKRFIPSDLKADDATEVLRESGAQILVNFLPVGAEQATRYYVEAALEAGVGLINCIPVFIASVDDWVNKFARKGLPVIGDDVKSQVGATIIHRYLASLFMDRGVRIKNTYQLNVGGNTDFLNMLNRERLTSKKISKTEAVRSQINHDIQADNIHIGPSDYVPWMNDNKVCFLRLEGEGFGGVPMNLELRLSVEDSPNSAGVVIDAIRCCKLALDRGIGGLIISPSAYFMKHPMTQYPDEEAMIMVEEFIAGNRER
jgi:myo-inositol-1-phosphate synthase